MFPSSKLLLLLALAIAPNLGECLVVVVRYLVLVRGRTSGQARSPGFRMSLAYRRVGRTTINMNAWMMDMKGVPSFYTDMVMRREAEGSNQRCRRSVIPDRNQSIHTCRVPKTKENPNLEG